MLSFDKNGLRGRINKTSTMFSGGLVLMGPVSCGQSVKQTASGGADTADCEL